LQFNLLYYQKPIAALYQYSKPQSSGPAEVRYYTSLPALKVLHNGFSIYLFSFLALVLRSFPTIFLPSNSFSFALTRTFKSLSISSKDRLYWFSFSFSIMCSFIVSMLTFLLCSVASASFICSSIFSFLLIFARYNSVLDQVELFVPLKQQIIDLHIQLFFRGAGCYY
jgi:hypothetical protein